MPLVNLLFSPSLINIVGKTLEDYANTLFLLRLWPTPFSRSQWTLSATAVVAWYLPDTHFLFPLLSPFINWKSTLKESCPFFLEAVLPVIPLVRETGLWRKWRLGLSPGPLVSRLCSWQLQEERGTCRDSNSAFASQASRNTPQCVFCHLSPQRMKAFRFDIQWPQPGPNL